MIECAFELDGKPMSALTLNGLSVPTFSGLGQQINRRASACIAGAGPIPPGTYYIFDRQSGGLPGTLRDLLNDRNEWFALYAADSKIDDEMICNVIKRRRFRLHPKGVAGISQGCITVNEAADYRKLRTRLKSTSPTAIPGTSLQAYGRVIVK